MLEASLGTAQHHNNLTIFPILAEKPREVSYGLMAEALALGILTIQEKNGGEVPLLLATNSGVHPILILDGEQLIGAKQNRMTNRTILLAPNSITEIPVSCMEQGRWHHETDHFSPAPQHAPSKVRRKARETENRASYMAESRGPGARSSYRDLAQAQGEVWEEIREFEDKPGHQLGYRGPEHHVRGTPGPDAGLDPGLSPGPGPDRTSGLSGKRTPGHGCPGIPFPLREDP